MIRTSMREALACPVRGIFCGFENSGEPIVDFPSNATGRPVLAISTVALTERDRNREVVLVFEDGDPGRPIVIGLRQPPAKPQGVTFEIDGERLVCTAKSEIVFRCGKASIQLLSDGSVRIRGANVLTRASATNRIRGGNVQIN